MVLSICTFSYAQTPSERNNAVRLGTTSAEFGYFEYLPADYQRDESTKYPLVIFFHGIGETGNGDTELGRVLAHGPPKMVEFENKDFPFILLTPQAPKEWYYMTTKINRFIEYAKATYKVDFDRIYVTGLSKGAQGAWFYSADFNQQVAAMVPVCGDGKYWEPCKYSGIPIWAFHNAEDDRISVDKTIRMIDTIKSCGGNPYLTIYKAKGHDAWTRTYKDQRMWDWLLSQRKGEDHPLANQFPTVDAGEDKTIVLPLDSIKLTASGSDADGKITDYIWRKVSGPGLTMSNIYSKTLGLTNLVEGVYKFMVIVKDNNLGSNYDEIYLTVLGKDCTNLKPDKPHILLSGANSLESSDEAEKYIWYMNEDLMDIHSKQIKITDLDASYTLVVENNGCKSEPSSSLIPASIENNLFSEVETFPNPTTGELFFEVKYDKSTDLELALIDLTGKTLNTFKIIRSKGRIDGTTGINIDQHPEGVYMLKVTIGRKTIIKRIVKISGF